MVTADMSAPDVAAPASAIDRRVAAVDVLRGLVIVIMALDHIRDYLHATGYSGNPLDPRQSDALLYSTRWITHLCAPTFVFLSGVSAWLQLARGRSRGAVARQLFTRGLWLVVLELTVVSFAWAWSFPYLVFLQVIWAIGVSMMVLAGLVFLPANVVLGIGVVIVAGHNALAAINPASLGAAGPALGFLFGPTIIPTWLVSVYPIVPWMGVMLLGYGLGRLFVEAKDARKVALVGAGMLALFVLLRATNLYGNPVPWTPQPDIGGSVMTFLDVSKYPPSLQFVCVTLGVVFVLYPLLAKLRGPVASLLLTYGSVPLMAYVAHIFVVHLVAVLSRVVTGQDASGLSNAIGKFIFEPTAQQGISFPLWYVYIAWVVVLATILPLCRWWAGVKQRRRDWWLSYL